MHNASKFAIRALAGLAQVGVLNATLFRQLLFEFGRRWIETTG